MTTEKVSSPTGRDGSGESAIPMLENVSPRSCEEYTDHSRPRKREEGFLAWLKSRKNRLVQRILTATRLVPHYEEVQFERNLHDYSVAIKSSTSAKKTIQAYTTSVLHAMLALQTVARDSNGVSRSTEDHPPTFLYTINRMVEHAYGLDELVSRKVLRSIDERLECLKHVYANIVEYKNIKLELDYIKRQLAALKLDKKDMNHIAQVTQEHNEKRAELSRVKDDLDSMMSKWPLDNEQAIQNYLHQVIMTIMEVDELLEGVYASANEVKESENPQNKLRELLEPIRSWMLDHASAKPKSSDMIPSQAGSSVAKKHAKADDAAMRIQALARGKSERRILTRQKSLLVQGTKVLRQYVLKTDRFPNCHVLDTPDGDLVPNFRRLDGTPFYGSAQPTLEGIKKVLNRVASDGFSKVIWINLREEAVIYVNGTPFTARRSANLNENDLIPGITGHRVQVMESSMQMSLREELTAAQNRFEYWHEEAEVHNNELHTSQVHPDQVLTLPQLYLSSEVTEAVEQIQLVEYHRIPIERGNAPEQADVERLMALIQRTMTEDGQDTAVVFNCQMGKRRTTTALVLSSLMWNGPRIDTKQYENAGEKEVEEGDFNVIREVQKHLPLGYVAKRWVDHVIDQCTAIYNLRSVISHFHALSTAEAKPAKRSFYLHHALSFLERYFYLIVFGSYILSIYADDADASEREEQPSFSKWLQNRHHLFRLLDDMGGVKYRTDSVLKGTAIKFDHFFGIARIPTELSPNLPNFRRIPQQPLFGTAQALEDGLHEAVAHLKQDFDQAIWINLREEAVMYVRGRPFVLRHAENLLENVEYPGVEVDEICAIERQLKREMIGEVKKANGLFLYWHEPKDMVNEERMEYIAPDEEIRTLDEVHADVATANAFDLRYARIPVSDETAPEEKDLDDMVRLLVPAFIKELGLDGHPGHEKKTAVICNCQMGRGRTTTALVCIYMLRTSLQDLVASGEGSLLAQICGGVNDTSGRRISSANAAEFMAIRKLLATLDNGNECKLLVDYAVDQCEHMQNLRDCIAQTRDVAGDKELPPAKREYYMRRAVNYLERYFYLICFASYVLEERHHLFRGKLFVNWMNERYGSDLYALLDNLCFEEEEADENQTSSMRWRWRRKRKLVSRLE